VSLRLFGGLRAVEIPLAPKHCSQPMQKLFRAAQRTASRLPRLENEARKRACGVLAVDENFREYRKLDLSLAV
jgi:hypothetical protein